MKKIFNFKNTLLLIAVLLYMVALLTSCGLEKLESIEVNSSVQTVYIGKFNYDDFKLTLNYDNGRTEDVEFTEDMISEVDKLKLFTEGTHEIKVTYKEKETTFTINVKRNVFEGVIFEDVETVYNGQDVVMEVKNVPEGTSVSYPGSNKFRNAGTYDVKAILRKDTYEAQEITAKLTIKKADYDLSEIKFEDMNVGYDGLKHSLKVEGELPNGLAVDYTITKEGGKEESGNTAQNAGVYLIKAMFTGDANNYNLVEPKYATMTIEKAKVDMSNISFEGTTVTYDRQVHTLAIEGALPTGVSVEYENNNKIDVGEYAVSAKFTHRDSINYEQIPDMVATLKIDKAEYDLSDIHFDNVSADYDGKVKSIVLDGELPTHLKVEFENNGHIDAGSYEVTIKFTNDDPNYNTPEDIKAQIVIKPIVANFDDVSFDRRRFVGYFVISYDEDLFVDANNYRPTNLPLGLEVEKVVYYKQDGLLTGSLDEFDGVTGNFVEKITEDGYYVAVALIKDNPNYKNIHPIKTQIRATAAYSRWVAGSAFYDPAWRWNTNLIKRTLTNSSIRLEYDDCVVLTEMLDLDGNVDEFYNHNNEVIVDSLLNKFDRVGAAYSTISEFFNINDNLNEFMVSENNEFLTNLYETSEALFLGANDEITQQMFQNKMRTGVIGINNEFDILGAKNYVYVKEPLKDNLASYFELIDGDYVPTQDTEIDSTKAYYREAKYEDYLLMVARLFGYEIIEDGVDNSINKLKEYANKLVTAYLAKKDLENRLLCDGAVYTASECFILPYFYDATLTKDISETETQEEKYVVATYLVITSDGKMSIWVNDLKTAFEITNISKKASTKVNELTLYTRCALFETREPGAYCTERHSALTIIVDGKEQILTQGDKAITIDIDNADYATTTSGKMSFEFLTEIPEGETIDNENIWSYEDFIKGIEFDGNKLAKFDERLCLFIDQYHGVIEVYDVVLDDEGNWIDYKVKYAEEVKPIIAVKGIKHVDKAGEFVVYIDAVDTEGYKMDGAWYTFLVIWQI